MNYTFRDYHLFQLLRRFESQHLPLDLFLSQYFKANKALGSKDRKVIADAAYGMTRWRLLLDYLIGVNPSWEKRFAIYNTFQPTAYATVNSIAPHIRVSCPKPLYEMLCRDYGEQRADYFSQINNTQAPITLRINPKKTTREFLIAKLNEHGYEATTCHEAPLGVQLKKRVALLALPQYQEGHFEIQDEGSQLVSATIDSKPGDKVLDYCAGAGGKSLAFAHTLEGKGQLYLHDIRPHILTQAKKRFKRAGIQNVQFLPPGHAMLPNLKGDMDWVVTDVPCSGTGTYRRHPDQKWNFTKEMVDKLVITQREIVEEALTYLKPGGKLVYITCSILKKENEEQLAYFLNKLPLKPVGAPLVTSPSQGGMDGFFAFVFERVDTQ